MLPLFWLWNGGGRGVRAPSGIRTERSHELSLQQILSGLQPHLYAQGPERPATEDGQADLHQVFLRGHDQTVRGLPAAPVAQAVNVSAAVSMMIGKNPEVTAGRAQAPQGFAKRLRIANAAEGRDRAVLQDIQLTSLLLRVAEAHGLMHAFRHGPLRRQARDHFPELRAACRRNLVAACQDDSSSPHQTGAWLP